MLMDVLLIGGTAVGSSLIWAFIIEPWLDRRPRNGGFVKPKRWKEN